jgi:hypothetical protein
MYLHLGQDVVVRWKDIVGIFDLETSSVSRVTKDYLKMAQRSGKVINVSLELPKSFVVCASEKDKAVSVYISQISPATLLRRWAYLPGLSGKLFFRRGRFAAQRAPAGQRAGKKYKKKPGDPGRSIPI